MSRDQNIRELGEICKNFDRKRVPLSAMQRAERQGPYPYHGATKVMDYVDDFLFEGTYVLLAEDGSVHTREGAPVVQLVHGQFWVNNHAHILQCDDESDTWYLYYALQVAYVMPWITGAVQLKLSQRWMNRMKLYWPDRARRAEIVSILRPYDDLITSMEAEAEVIEEMLTELYAERFLRPLRVVNDEIVPPEGWTMERVIDHFELERGFEPGSANCNEEEDGWRFLRVGDVTGKQETPLYTDVEPAITAEPEDVLTTFDGTVGHTAYGLEGAFNTGVRRVRPKTENLSQAFAWCVMTSYPVRWTIESYATGTTILHSSSSLPHLDFPWPNGDEVAEFVDFSSPLWTALTSLDSKVKTCRSQQVALIRNLHQVSIE